jgi:choline dehydrogenase
VHQALRYVLSRKGMLAMVGAPMRAFVCSREGLEAPDLTLGLIPMLMEPGPKGPRISRQSGVTLYAHPMRPESKGPSTSPRPIRTGHRRSTSTSFQRRRMRRSPCAPSVSPVRS